VQAARERRKEFVHFNDYICACVMLQNDISLSLTHSLCISKLHPKIYKKKKEMKTKHIFISTHKCDPSLSLSFGLYISVCTHNAWVKQFIETIK
jgi:hypothetical protein